MRIKLSNGTEFFPIVVTGESRQVQGARRDVITFVFPDTENIVTLDGLFTEENCENISFLDDNGEVKHIYKGYTIRAELKKEAVVVKPETIENEPIIENRIFVSMGQRTYTETRLASLTDTIDVLVMESLM